MNTAQFLYLLGILMVIETNQAGLTGWAHYLTLVATGIINLVMYHVFKLLCSADKA